VSITSNDIGKIYSFSTYDGVQHRHLKFSALLDADTLLMLGVDVQSKHASIYPYLPEGSPSSYKDYVYGKFVDLTGNKFFYFGVPCIREDSLVEDGQPSYRITLRNLDSNKLNSVRSMLVASGVEDFTIEQI